MIQKPWIDEATLRAFLEQRPNTDDDRFGHFVEAAQRWAAHHLFPGESNDELKCLVTVAHCLFLPARALTTVEITRLLEIVAVYEMFAASEEELLPFDECLRAQLSGEVDEDVLDAMVDIAITLRSLGMSTWPLSHHDYQRCLWVAATFITHWLQMVEWKQRMTELKKRGQGQIARLSQMPRTNDPTLAAIYAKRREILARLQGTVASSG